MVIKNNELTFGGGVLTNPQALSGVPILDCDVITLAITDLNDCVVAGIYQLGNPANAPVSGIVTCMVIPIGNFGGGNINYCRQLLFPINNNKIYTRYRSSGTWTDWTTLHS